MAKSNIRSMRFSDEILKIIESQPGHTFTAKFEALVTRCMRELPRRERELASIDELIRTRKEQLKRMTQNVEQYKEKLRRIEYNLTQLEYNIEKAQELKW